MGLRRNELAAGNAVPSAAPFTDWFQQLVRGYSKDAMPEPVETS